MTPEKICIRCFCRTTRYYKNYLIILTQYIKKMLNDELNRAIEQ